MPPLYVAIHCALILALGAITAVVARRSRKAGLVWVAVVVGVGLGAQLLVVACARAVANALDWPDLFFFQKFSVHIASAVLVAVPLLQKKRAAKVRAALLGLILLGLACYASRDVIWAPPPLRDQRVDRPAAGSTTPTLVRQTETSTCAPAAAATLLRALGVDSDANERDLTALSFTHPTQGTSDLGLFRGLSLAAPERTVRYRWRSLEEIRAATPCVVFVSLERSRVPDQKTYEFMRDQCNWNEGESHAVVCFGFGQDQNDQGSFEVAVIGDPNYGVERWSLDHFVYLWDGSTLEIE